MITGACAFACYIIFDHLLFFFAFVFCSNGVKLELIGLLWFNDSQASESHWLSSSSLFLASFLFTLPSFRPFQSFHHSSSLIFPALVLSFSQYLLKSSHLFSLLLGIKAIECVPRQTKHVTKPSLALDNLRLFCTHNIL